MLVQSDPIPAAIFGDDTGDFCRRHGAFDSVRVGGQPRYADADCQLDGAVIPDDAQITDGSPHILADAPALIERAVANQDAVFVIADSRHRANLVKVSGQQQGDLPDRFVAGLVAERFRNGFHFVEIQMEYTMARRLAVLAGHRSFEAVFELHAVDQTGQIVIARLHDPGDIGGDGLQQSLFAFAEIRRVRAIGNKQYALDLVAANQDRGGQAFARTPRQDFFPPGGRPVADNHVFVRRLQPGVKIPFQLTDDLGRVIQRMRAAVAADVDALVAQNNDGQRDIEMVYAALDQLCQCILHATNLQDLLVAVANQIQFLVAFGQARLFLYIRLFFARNPACHASILAPYRGAIV